MRLLSHPASIYDLVPELVSGHRDVESCTLLEVKVPPSMEFRPGATPELAELVREARLLQGPDDSFTETLMTLGANRGCTDSILEVAQYHQPLGEALARHDLSVDELTPDILARLSEHIQANRMLVITSAVGTRHGEMHIPLIDFKLAATASNHESVLAAARRLGDGWVVVSGSSFHFYGADLLTIDQLREWLLRAQLLSRYVDTRWVTHQLLEGRCALRLSRGGANDSVPFVLKWQGVQS